MSETEKRVDKRLYSYKQALSQPYWIQKINDEFSLKQPIKFSRVVYFVFLFGLFWLVFEKLISFISYGLRGMLITLISVNLSAFLSDVVIDGKSVIFYLKDYLLFYVSYGSRADKIYINKGQVYKKLESEIKLRREVICEK